MTRHHVEVHLTTVRANHAPGDGLPDLTPLAWMSDGACVAAGHPDLWYADREHWQDTVTAKRICNTRCPVVALCLNHAFENDERGTWGGTSEHERRKLRRKWRESAA